MICLIASASTFLPTIAYTSQGPEVSISEIDPRQPNLVPAIENLLRKGDADHLIDFIIYMETKAKRKELSLPEDRSERRYLVVNKLQDVATHSRRRWKYNLTF